MSDSKSVAVACETEAGLGGGVSAHFGHTPYFVVAEVAGGKVVSTRVVASPGHGEGCSMPQFVQTLGVQALIVGGLGGGAASRLEAFGIAVFGGTAGSAGEALQAWADGKLGAGAVGCSGHGAEGGGSHSCGHHH
jgi:predicted Fe-Mo cluster-binding NifX family protein